MPRKFMFVENLPPGASTRAVELQQAELRKHAATVSHNRRKTQGSQPEEKSVASVLSEGSYEDRASLKDAQSSPALVARRSYASATERNTTDVQPVHGSLVFAAARPGRHSVKVKQRYQPKKAQAGSQMEIAERLRSIWARDFSYLEQSSRHMDPFYTIAHNNSSSFFRATEYFTQVIVPNNAPVHDIFEVSNVYCSIAFDIHQVEHFLHAWAGAMNLIRSFIAPQTKAAQDALRHTGVAMGTLRRALTNPKHLTDDYTICSVLMLIVLSRAYGDLEGYETHIRNLRLMVKARGGVNSLGLEGMPKCTILQWDSFWALDNGASMFADYRVLKPPVYPGQPPFSDEVSAAVKTLPRGFRILAEQGSLALDVIRILGRVDQAHRTFGANQGGNDLRTQTWRPNKYSDFWESCTCLSNPEPGFEKFLCLTLLLYSANEFSPVRKGTGGMTLYSGPRSHLTRLLPLLQVKLGSERECLVWIWMVLVDSWRADGGSLSSTGELLLMKFRHAFRELNSWTQVDKILSGYFYSVKFASACREYWDPL